METGNDSLGKPVLTETSVDKANILAKYFSSVFTQEKDLSDIVNECIDFSNIKQMSEVEFKSEEILKKLLDLKICKSPGPDLIHPRVLKEVANEISPLLCDIFNNSIKHAVLPSDWKLADVTPIFKKGDKNVQRITDLLASHRQCVRSYRASLGIRLKHILGVVIC